MNLVTVKAKFQVVIPQDVRKLAGVAVGDLLEATVADGKILLTPKSLVDRHIAEGLADMKAGRTTGSFASGKEAVAALEARLTRRRAKTKA